MGTGRGNLTPIAPSSLHLLTKARGDYIRAPTQIRARALTSHQPQHIGARHAHDRFCTAGLYACSESPNNRSDGSIAFLNQVRNLFGWSRLYFESDDRGLLLRPPQTSASGVAAILDSPPEAAVRAEEREQLGPVQGDAPAGPSRSSETQERALSVHVDSPQAEEIEAVDAEQTKTNQSSFAPSGSEGSDSLPTCLICLEHMDLSSAHVVPLGCQCKGAAGYRHRACLDRWLTVKGDTICDVCRTEMTAVSLPPPPPVPGFVVFPQLDHSFEVQWDTFLRYMWHNTVAILVYCIVFALVMDVKLYVALLIAFFMIFLLLVRYVVTVAINTLARRTVLSFQAPDTMNGG